MTEVLTARALSVVAGGLKVASSCSFNLNAALQHIDVNA
jgi:hypothetical protein